MVNVRSDWRLIGIFSRNFIKIIILIVINLIFYLDDNNWNCENLKLGLIEDQSYSDLNLDICQFLKKNSNETTLNTSILNESLQYFNKIHQNTKKDAQLLFTSEKLTNSNINSIKHNLYRNYWEDLV